MADSEPKKAVVYTETVVFAPPEQYAADAPYQIAIVDLETGGRKTVRILANEVDQRVVIGDKVVFAEERGGVDYYRKAGTAPVNTAETDRPLA